MIEKMQAQIVAEVDDSSFKRAGDQIGLYARDTKKKLDKSFLFKLQLDKAKTKVQLDSARALLRKAKKDGDKALVLQMTLKTNQLQSKLTEAGRSLRNFENTGKIGVSRLSRLFGGLGDQVGKLVTRLGALALGAGLLSLAKQAVVLGDKLERANIGFTTMLGSAEEAKILLEDLTTFAAETPFELIGIRENAKQLLAMGISGKNILPVMKELGDISAGLNVPLERLALNFGQVKVQGKLTGRELRDFSVAGVPLIAELAKNLNKSEKEIGNMVSAGEIGFNDVQRAFETMTQEGGKFANLMDKLSATASGKWSNAIDEYNTRLEKLGTQMLPFAKGVVDAINYLFVGLSVFWKHLSALVFLAARQMDKAMLFVAQVFGNMRLAVKIALNAVTGSFKDFLSNAGIFARNLGKAFDSFPSALSLALNKGIEKIESFLNKASDGVNKFAKKLGFKGDLVGKVSLGRVDYGDGIHALEKFKNANRDASKEENKLLWEQAREFNRSIVYRDGLSKARLDKAMLNLVKEDSAKRKVNTKYEYDDDKTKGDILDDEKARAKESKKLRDEAEKSVKGFYGTVRDELDKSQKKIDDFDKKITDSTDKINKWKEELKGEEEELGIELAERRLEVEEKIIELEQKGVSKRMARIVSEESLRKIGGGSIGGGITGTETLELKRLYDERAKLEENASLITEANKEQASENETERILREFEEKKASIEEEMKLEQVKLDDFEANKLKEQDILKSIDDYRTALELDFTDLLKVEAIKRISILESIRQKAIQTANAVERAGVSTSNNTNNNNTTVNLNGTGHTSVDARVIGDALTKQIDLSSKGIN